MSDALEAIENLPDVSFIDNLTLEDAQSLLVQRYNEHYADITGHTVTLQKGDPIRILTLAIAQIYYQLATHVDKAGKMNLLKYSFGDYLKNIAALKNVTEVAAKKAQVNVLFTLSSARAAVTAIPTGTRVTSSFDVYFETTEYHEIAAGDTEIEITMTCTEAGEQGNDFLPGELATLVDPVGFVASVRNTTTSSGGRGKESDDSIRERTYLAPSSYSTAGPTDSYIYHAKTFDPAIGDVHPYSPEPCVVDVRFIMADGTLPDAAEIAGVKDALSSRTRRPLAEQVLVGAPDTVSYSIQATYYINGSDSDRAAAIQSSIASAVNEYISWQCAKIGRDINPDELRKRIMLAGAKRVIVTSPIFTVLTELQVAVIQSQSVTYGGLEDD